MIITLIHGTFATDAPWTQENSEFRRFFADKMPKCRFEVFNWSGVNSHAARIEAAAAVHDHVLKLRRLDPDAPHFLVGHSHGGMVAAYACRSEEVRDALSGVITLGTPFIDVTKRDFRPTIRLFRLIVTVIAMFGFVAFMAELFVAWLVAGVIVMLVIPEDAAHLLMMRLALLSLTIAAGAVLIVLVRWITSQRVKEELRCWAVAIVRRQLRRQAKAFGVLRPRYDTLHQVPLLIITVRGDEARFWLTLLWRVGDAVHFLHSAISYLSIRLPPVVALVSAFNFGHQYYVDHVNTFGFHAHYWTYFDHYIIAPMISLSFFVFGMFARSVVLVVTVHLLMATWPFVIRSHQYGYGEASLVFSWLLNIRSILTPGSGVAWIHHRVVAPPLIFGRHSYFYKDPNTLEAITDWIQWRIGAAELPFADDRSSERAWGDGAVRFVAWLILAAIAIWLMTTPEFQWKS